MKPIIGIIGSNMQFPAVSFLQVEKFYTNTAYVNAIQQNGGIPMAIPVLNDHADLSALLRLCNGVLIPGGEDVDPKFYHENPHPKIETIRPDMDAYVFKALDICITHDIPVFGICRGLQIINVAFGGSLYQDMSLYEKETILHLQRYDRSYTVHSVDIVKNSMLYEIFGQEKTMVNTLHHQAIKQLGEDLVATGFAPDGVIEAIEHQSKPVFAVQWHPEELTKSAPVMNGLFRHFAQNMAGKHTAGF